MMDDKPDYKQVMTLGIHIYVLSDRQITTEDREQSAPDTKELFS